MTRLEAVKAGNTIGERLALDEARFSTVRRRQHVLAIGAHPDDVELGIGGILAAHVAVGDFITILTMSDGVNGGTPAQRRDEAQMAADLLGAVLITQDLVDSEICADVVTIRIIEAVIAQCEPDIIYTHSAADTHQDHRSIHFATVAAGRTVAGLYCYGAPSLTHDFNPVRFNDIEENLEFKLNLLKCFESQQHRYYFEPELIIAKARYWGSVGRWRFAEPLEVVHERSPGHVELAGYVERRVASIHSSNDDEPQQHPSRVGAAAYSG